MAGWNGSGMGGNSAPVKPKVTAKKPSPIRGIVAGAVLVAAVIGCYFAFFSGGEKPQVEAGGKKTSKIKEVNPAAAPTNAIPEKPKKVVEIRKLENGKLMKYIDGKEAWMFPRPDYHGPIITTKVNRVETLAEKTFKHSADRQIASLIMHRPGDKISGSPDYKGSFVRNFLKSYENPFMIEPEDTPEQKELKKAVAEVKGDLKARYEAGEDIAQLMIDTRKNLRELASYKREIEKEVTRLSREEGTTAADVEDFVMAANKMLEDRGIHPMGISGLLKHQINILKAKQNTSKGAVGNE